MRVVLSTFDSRGGVEPYAALARKLRELGAEAVVCAPPDCADRLAEVGVPFTPIGDPVRTLVHTTPPPSVAEVAAKLIATQFDALAKAAEGCDVIVGSGVLPAAAGARSVADLLGVPSVHVTYCPIFLPSPHHRPQPLPGLPVSADVTDPAALEQLSIDNYNAFLREPLNAARLGAGLPPVDNVRDYIHTARPWLAADPVLAPWPGDGVDVLQTGAWVAPDERPLPADLAAFLADGPPPVYVSFGSMVAPDGIAGLAIEAIRAQGRRVIVGRGWAELDGVDDRPDCLVVGEVNQQQLFRRVAAVVHHGGAGTTTTATLAGAPQVVVAQWADQPYFADRVAALRIGAGITVGHGPGPTAEAFAAALATALASRERATAVAATIRTDGTTVAAEKLLELAA
ncbi:glycosyltransferase [Asanoa sp. WMMD1127]|uniref:glycosyltransferase n=1 Tax=Asanoa sp. WMMD1127 TaxID=3016107 RepID=UPI0024167CCA|nr:glycosyltransferase [Asanoa sp. WMMD1127]MDG4824599.1 glycosyltransferase [Asanoa sp. WMMD1127]